MVADESEQGSEGVAEIEADSSDSEGERKKIGDRLFDDGDAKIGNEADLREMAKEMSSEMLEQVIQKESPELIAMLHELKESMKEINTRLKPVLTLLKENSQNPPKRLSKLPIF